VATQPFIPLVLVGSPPAGDVPADEVRDEPLGEIADEMLDETTDEASPAAPRPAGEPSYDDVRALCEELFPIKSRRQRGELSFISIADRPTGCALVVRLLTWDIAADGTFTIRDIKEQEVYLPLPVGDGALERLRCFLAALANVLTDALDTPELETLMPHELLITAPLRQLKTATREAYEKSLRARSRLGRYIAP